MILPSSWLATTLGQVVPYGKSSKAAPNEIMPDEWVLELEDIEKDTSKILQRVVAADRNPKSTKNRFQTGDVLYGKLRPYLNKVVIADTSGVCTTEIVPITAPQGLDSRYLFFWLKSPAFLNYVEHVSHGLNMPRLGTEAAQKAPFVLAPENEQKRIADTLNAVLARVEVCRARLDRAAEIIQRFRQSVLTSATSGALTSDWRQEPHYSPTVFNPHEALGSVPGTWEVRPAKEVVEPGADIVYGIIQPGPRLDHGIPYIRGMDIINGKIQVDQLLRTSAEIAKRYERASLKGGDVLLGIIRATKVAIVPDELEGANITQGTARFRPSGTILTKFLATVLESPSVQAWLHSKYRGIDMPGLNLADIRLTPIPIPPLPEQHEIVRRVEALLSFADEFDKRLQSARAAVESLTPALLAKAFRGELVPQDPTDEPASDLLKRIQAARVAPTSPIRHKKVMKETPSPTGTFQERLSAAEATSFNVTELRMLHGGEYAAFRDELFSLLAGPAVILQQAFDVEAREMRFRKVSA